MDSPNAQRAPEKEAPKAQYTTAGTLFKPNSILPMQPPNRRGRTKWALDGTPSSELSLFPRSAVTALHLHNSLRPDNTVLPKYSPLQQNMDRAVSPSRRKQQQQQQNDDVDLNIPAGPVDTLADFEPRGWVEVPTMNGSSVPTGPADTLASSKPRDFVKSIAFNGPSIPTDPAGTLASRRPKARVPPLILDVSDKREQVTVTVTSHPAGDEEEDDDSEFFNDGFDKTLRGLSVKSLHNLASYPNPNQKRAQKTLMGGRPMSSGGAPLFSPDEQVKSRPMTPVTAVFVPGVARQDNDYQQKLTEPKPSAYYTQISRYNSSNIFYKTPVDSQEPSGGYKTTLAEGPGAPKPLTAGPPGLRQHTPAIETIQRALQERARSRLSDSASSDSTIMPGYDGAMGPSHRVDTSPVMEEQEESDPGSENEAFHQLALPDLSRTEYVETAMNETSKLLMELRYGSILEPKTNDSSQTESSGTYNQNIVYDAKLPGEVSVYYPHGFPTMNVVKEVDPEWLEQDHATERIPLTPGSWMNDKAAMQRRDKRSLQQFYAGYMNMGGDMDHVIKEAERRQDQRALGVIGDRRPKPQAPPPKKVSVEQAMKQTTAEATKPLLNMVFSTLVRHAEMEIDCAADGQGVIGKPLAT